MANMVINPGAATDAQARNLVIKALRAARREYRLADTIGEKFEREIDRLIKRKTRISTKSFLTLAQLYEAYTSQAAYIQKPLQDAYDVTAQF